MELNFVKLIFTFVPKSHLSDPYLFFGCRSAFDEAFRAAVGCRRGECLGCAHSGGCAYAATFSQELSRDPEAVRRHQKPPLPFVFRMPLLPPPPHAGRTMSCTLILFGSAIQLLDLYLSAVRILLTRFGLELLRVEAVSPGGELSPLSGAAALGELPLLSAADPAAAGPLAPDRLTITLVTPLKLLQDGKMLKEITFSHLVRALMRRVSSMAHYYAALELSFDYPVLAARSAAVEMTTCDCRVAKWGARISGITGTLQFRGDLEDFHLLFILGSEMNLGKGASFGLGHFNLVR